MRLAAQVSATSTMQGTRPRHLAGARHGTLQRTFPIESGLRIRSWNGMFPDVFFRRPGSRARPGNAQPAQARIGTEGSKFRAIARTHAPGFVKKGSENISEKGVREHFRLNNFEA